MAGYSHNKSPREIFIYLYPEIFSKLMSALKVFGLAKDLLKLGFKLAGQS